MQIREQVMTASNEHSNGFHTNELYKSYVKPGLTPQNESGSRIISVARFDKLEVRLIEFVDRNGRDSSDL